MSCSRILVLNANASRELTHSLQEILLEAQRHGFQTGPEISIGELSSEGLAPAGEGAPDLALVCLSQDLPTKIGPNFKALRERVRGVPVLFIVESGEPRPWCELLQFGRADFLSPPLSADLVLPRLLQMREPPAGAESPLSQLTRKFGLKQFIGTSEPLQREIRKLPKLARYDTAVLITGETGTGKEMFARAIHHLSPRHNNAFVPLNCGAIPLELVENELFGHNQGAFTGATSSSPGLIQDAEGGTLFLDEIDSLPLQSQVKLLRFLQDKEYRPLGARKSLQADVRIVAATNADIQAAVNQGRFRADLFYRLNVIPVALPALRERKEDIAPLAEHLIRKYSTERGLPGINLSKESLDRLTAYDWPGNVRELENIIEHAVLLCDEPFIQPADIRLPAAAAGAPGISFKAMKARAVAEFEMSYIRQVLTANEGNITKAATAAKKNRRAFWQLMQKHKISLPRGVEREN